MTNLRFAAHLGVRAPDRPLFRALAASPDPIDQIRFMADHGFSGVSDNFHLLRSSEEQARIGAEVRRLGLEFSSFVHDPLNWNGPVWTGHGRTHRDGLQTSLKDSLAAAQRSGSRSIVCVTGRADSQNRREAIEAMAANLSWAGDLAAQAEVALCVEATHPQFAPGSLIERIDEALALIERIDHPHVLLDFDVGHVALHGDDVIRALEVCRGRIGVIQIADVPGRIEPGGGTLDWPTIFQAIADTGYSGLIELELEPSGRGAGGEQLLLDRLGAISG